MTKLIKDKEREKKLAEDFKKEMDSRTVDWSFIGLGGLIKLNCWGIFSKYRFIYFTQRCVDGMAHQLAWSDASKMSKEELMKILKALKWAK